MESLLKRYPGQEGSFDATLLWTNENPTANFAAQPLSLDYSGYEYLWVFSLTDTTCTNYSFNSPDIRGFIINVRTDLSVSDLPEGSTRSAFGYASKLEAGYKDDGTYYWFTQRLCTPKVEKNQLEFSTGYYCKATKGTNTRSKGNGADYCIPYKIFGINRNARGAIRMFNLPLNEADNVISWVSGEEATDIVLPAGFNYISVEGRQRNERYDFWTWDNCWMSVNIQGYDPTDADKPEADRKTNSTRDGYNPDTTTFVSGIASNIFQKYDTALVQTGYRYESSADCRRFTKYTYDGNTLKRDESFKCPLYGNGANDAYNFYNADGPATTTGIQRVFGLQRPLWGEDYLSAVPATDTKTFDYEAVTGDSSKEIAILVTSDLHGVLASEGDDDPFKPCTLSSSELNQIKRNKGPTIKSINYKMIKDSRDFLQGQGIETLLVDAGDYGHISAGNTSTPNTIPYIDQEFGLAAVRKMNEMNWFISVPGDHEFIYASDLEQELAGSVRMTAQRMLDEIFPQNNSLTACNFRRPDKSLYCKPYRTAKIGDIKIAMIGIGCYYQRPEWSDHYKKYTDLGYSWIPSYNLQNNIQKYVNDFRDAGFDYIIAVTHASYWSTDANSASASVLGPMLSGIDAWIGGHSHQHSPAQSTYGTNDPVSGGPATITDADGKSIPVFEVGAYGQCFMRLKLQEGQVSWVATCTETISAA